MIVPPCLLPWLGDSKQSKPSSFSLPAELPFVSREFIKEFNMATLLTLLHSSTFNPVLAFLNVHSYSTYVWALFLIDVYVLLLLLPPWHHAFFQLTKHHSGLSLLPLWCLVAQKETSTLFESRIFPIQANSIMNGKEQLLKLNNREKGHCTICFILQPAKWATMTQFR